MQNVSQGGLNDGTFSFKLSQMKSLVIRIRLNPFFMPQDPLSLGSTICVQALSLSIIKSNIIYDTTSYKRLHTLRFVQAGLTLLSYSSMQNIYNGIGAWSNLNVHNFLPNVAIPN